MSRDFRRGLIAGVALTLCAIAAVGLLAKLRAGEIWVVVHGYAVHLDGHNYCNDTTQGLGVELRQTADFSFAAGVYENSLCRSSLYVAEEFCPVKFSTACLGALLGLVSGYRHDRGELTPIGGLVLAVNRGRVGARLVYVPEIAGRGNVLWLSGAWRW